MVCSDVLFAMHHTFPYFIHGARALCACVFCFPQLYERISGSCDRAHAYVSARARARDLRVCSRTYNHARPRAPRHASLQCL